LGLQAMGETTAIDTIFDAVDIDNSGVLAFEEFKVWYEHKMQADKEHSIPEEESVNVLSDMNDLFQQHDKDGSGELDRGEFAAIMATVATSDWKECFDRNRNRVYFFNRKTKKSKWVPPDMGDVDLFLKDKGMWPGDALVKARDTKTLKSLMRRTVSSSAVRSLAAMHKIHDGQRIAKRHRKTLNMWKVRLRFQRTQEFQMLVDFMLFIIYFFLLFYFVSTSFPEQTAFLQHQEAITDFILDEEFDASDVSNHKKCWDDVATLEEFYQWMNGPLHGALWDGDDSPVPMLDVNHLIGSIHIRQVRVNNIACPNMSMLVNPGGTCQGKWEPTLDRMYEYNKSATYDAETTAWNKNWAYTYHESFNTTLKSDPVFVPDLWGTARYKDGEKGAGYSIDLPRNGTAWTEKVKEMEEKGFIDKNTRIVSVQFNLYNGNDFDLDDHRDSTTVRKGVDKGDAKLDDQFLVTELRHVISESGSFAKYAWMISVRPMRTYFYALEETKKIVLFAFWLGWFVMLFAKEIFYCSKQGFKQYFFRSEIAFWNWYEIIFFGTCCQNFYRVYDFYLLSLHTLDQCSTKEAVSGDRFIDMHDFASAFIRVRRSIAVLVFLAWFKLFKYMTLSVKLNFLWRVVVGSGPMIAAFFVVYLILIFAFAFLCMFVFGWDSRDFHNVPSALFSTLRLSLGMLDFNYLDWKNTDPFWAPLVLTAIMFVMMLVVVNIFIAIVCEAFTEVKDESDKRQEDLRLLGMRGSQYVQQTSGGRSVNQGWTVELFQYRNLLKPSNARVKIFDDRLEPSKLDDSLGQNLIPDGPYKGAMKRLKQVNQVGGKTGAHIVRLHYMNSFKPMLGDEIDDKRNHDAAGRAKKQIPNMDHMEFTPESNIIKVVESSFEYANEPNNLVDMLKHLEQEVVTERLTRDIPVACLRLPRANLANRKMSRLLDSLRPRDMCQLKSHSMVGNCIGVKFLTPHVLRTQTPHGEYEDHFAYFEVDSVVSPQAFSNHDDEQANADGSPRKHAEIIAEEEIERELQDATARDPRFGHTHYGKPTTLKPCSDIDDGSFGWTKDEDNLLWTLRGTERGRSQNTAANVAELLDKGAKEVMARGRFLEEVCRKNQHGKPIVPVVLEEKFMTSKSLSWVLWWRSMRDPKIPEYSWFKCGMLARVFGCKGLCSLCSSPIEMDLTDFLNSRIEMLESETNSHDMEALETAFSGINIPLDSVLPEMIVFLLRVRGKTERYISRHYRTKEQYDDAKAYVILHYVDQLSVSSIAGDDDDDDAAAMSDEEEEKIDDLDVFSQLLEMKETMRDMRTKIDGVQKQGVNAETVLRDREQKQTLQEEMRRVRRVREQAKEKELLRKKQVKKVRRAHGSSISHQDLRASEHRQPR